jgi:hypothetical protein
MQQKEIAGDLVTESLLHAVGSHIKKPAISGRLCSNRLIKGLESVDMPFCGQNTIK